jgi:ABC-type amino acid transport substrate-binding protein
VKLVALPLLAACLLSACGGSDASAVGIWRDEEGRTVESIAGPEHCDWQSATFLYAETDFDEPGATAERQQFLRDPEGVLSGEVVVAYDGSASLPDAAVDTGLRLESMEFWAEPTDDPSGPEAVYVVEGDSVERWPRTREEVACA